MPRSPAEAPGQFSIPSPSCIQPPPYSHLPSNVHPSCRSEWFAVSRRRLWHLKRDSGSVSFPGCGRACIVTSSVTSESQACCLRPAARPAVVVASVAARPGRPDAARLGSPPQGLLPKVCGSKCNSSIPPYSARWAPMACFDSPPPPPPPPGPLSRPARTGIPPDRPPNGRDQDLNREGRVGDRVRFGERLEGRGGWGRFGPFDADSMRNSTDDGRRFGQDFCQR